MKRRLAALAVIFLVWLVVVLRGRGGGPIPLRVAVRAATNGSFYHWRADLDDGSWAEGWCAQRRSRAIGSDGIEVRTSPSGVYRKAKGGTTFEPRNDVVGMEEGSDFLTIVADHLTGLDTKLTPLGGDRWRGGAAIYTLEPRTARILRIDAPNERITIDYPLALSSDVFERPL